MGVLVQADYDALVAALGIKASTIKIRHTDATITSYAPAADTDTARGTALLTALAEIAAKESLFLGPYIYDLGSPVSQICFPADIRYFGVGKNLTRITTSRLGSGVDATLNTYYVGDNSQFHNLWFDMGKNQVGVYQCGLGPTENATTHLINCKITGNTDAIFLTKNNSTICLYDTDLYSNWDAINIIASGCKVIGVRSSSNLLGTYELTNTLRGISAQSACTIKLRDFDFNVWGIPTTIGARDIYGIVVMYPGAYTIELKGVNFNVAATAGQGLMFDLDVNLNTNPTIASDCHGSNADGSLNSIGVIHQYVNGFRANATSVVAINPPSSVAGTVTVGSGHYLSTTNGYILSVVAYKTVGGVRVYSTSATSSEIDNTGNNLSIHWTWTASPDEDVEGYIVTMFGADCGIVDSEYTDDVYYDVGNVTSWVDDGTHWAGPSIGSDPPYSANPGGKVYNNLIPVLDDLPQEVMPTDAGITAIQSGLATETTAAAAKTAAEAAQTRVEKALPDAVPGTDTGLPVGLISGGGGDITITGETVSVS